MRIKTYTKKDIVKQTAELLNEKIYTTEKVVDGVFQTLREMLSEDSKELRIEIRNFGVFEVKPTKAKPKARNPRTNEIVYVPPRRKTHFKPGKLIKAALKKPKI
jgi:nucleoid DNA-binding protein